MASPRRLVAAIIIAALAIVTIAAAWPTAFDGNTPGSTPTDGDMVSVVRVMPSSSSSHDTTSHRIACGGTSPLTEKCTRSTVTHDGGRKAGMAVETGFNGTVKWRLAGDEPIAKWECSWELAGFTEPDCTMINQIGDFDAGDTVTLQGTVVLPGEHPVDDRSYGIWEVSFENK